LDSLDAAKVPWAIVTSGTKPLLNGWLERMNLVAPQNSVVAEDVQRGKPDPACYLLGKARLGLKEEASALVIEDAPAGIKAGKAAGCAVIGLVTTHSIEKIEAAGADWIVENLRSVVFRGRDERTGQLKISISKTLQKVA